MPFPALFFVCDEKPLKEFFHGFLGDKKDKGYRQVLPFADEILNALLELSRKMLKFIKQNNIYGTAYREKPKRAYHPEEDADYIRDLAHCKEQVDKTLASIVQFAYMKMWIPVSFWKISMPNCNYLQ